MFRCRLVLLLFPKSAPEIYFGSTFGLLLLTNRQERLLPLALKHPIMISTNMKLAGETREDTREPSNEVSWGQRTMHHDLIYPSWSLHSAKH
jgi:hypothetical protein